MNLQAEENASYNAFERDIAILNVFFGKPTTVGLYVVMISMIQN